MVRFSWTQESAPALIFADGGTVGGSPGRSIYYSLKLPDGSVRRFQNRRFKLASAAEALSLISALRWIRANGNPGDLFHVHMDCQNLVNRICGDRPRRKPCALETKARSLYRALIGRGVQVRVLWNPRETLVRELGH